MKRYIYIIVLTSIFTFFIFFIKNIFFVKEDKALIENKYIEESLIVAPLEQSSNEQEKKSKLDYNKIKKRILEIRKKKEELRLASKVYFEYTPSDYEREVTLYTQIVSQIVRSDIFNNKIISLWIDMYQKKIDVRWKMKNKKVKLFWVSNIKKPEFISLFIHEFSHYIDLYYFNKTIVSDKSDKFYNISWKNTKILKKWQKSKDFVSGYAMTNKYEDFAESFTYYVLHNKDFIYKTKNSEAIKSKYLFFKYNLFKSDKFTDINFSRNKKVLDYYRDTTKIDIKKQNFLQYIKN